MEAIYEVYYNPAWSTLRLAKPIETGAGNRMRELISINIMAGCQLSQSGVKKMNDGHKRTQT
jgi:hypothetical protein